MSAWSIPITTNVLTYILCGLIERFATEQILVLAISVSSSSSAHFRRPIARPVSCYAIIIGMAASKPTSWLSSQLDFLIDTSLDLGTLIDDLGYLPLDIGPLHPMSVRL